MAFDAAWQEEIRSLAREAQGKVDMEHGRLLEQATETLVGQVVPSIADAIEALEREGIQTSVQAMMGRRERQIFPGLGEVLGDAPGLVVSTRLADNREGPMMGAWVFVREVAGQQYPEIFMQAGEESKDAYDAESKATTEKALQIIRVFVEEVAREDRRRRLDIDTLAKIERNFPRRQ